jgi:hypothetical protein
MRLGRDGAARVGGWVVKINGAQLPCGCQRGRARLFGQLAQQEGLALLVQALRHLWAQG